MERMFFPRGLFSLQVAVLALAGILVAGPVCAQGVAQALLREDGALPGGPVGHTVSSLNNSAVNHVGGYAVAVNTTDGATTLSHIWGAPAGGPATLLRTEGTFGSLVQTAFESFYGMSDAGQLAYSATGTGGPVGNFDSVWRDDTPVAVEGDPVPSLPGQYYVFASRPGITADGQPYWSSGYSSTQGGTSQNRVLLFGMGATVVLQGGTAVPGLPFPLVTSTLDFDYRFSELGNHYLFTAQMSSGSTNNDNAMVMDGRGLEIDGVLVREQTPVPAAAGGLPGENWDNFDFCGATESGDWFFTGDTEPSTTNDEIIVKNGAIVYREGDVVDGEILSGDIEATYMNADGDIGYIWDIQANTLEALFLNNELLLREGDLVDLTGDGVVDPDKRLANFTGISALTISDRDLGLVNLYFTADIDTAGTRSTLDDIEGFFCLSAPVGPVAVALQSFEGATGPRGEISLSWTTSLEADHVGFHVYRQRNSEGSFERLTRTLVLGRGRYEYVDRDTEPGVTYSYKLGAVDRHGREEMLGFVTVTAGAWNGLLASSPNPFAAATDVRFALAGSAEVRLAVFDAQGRVVRRLLSGQRNAGLHVVRWDGRDDAGRPVAGGLYFTRLDIAGEIHTGKMLRTE